MQPYQRRLLQLALDQGILSFGSFRLKSGRQSPYFFNAGGFNDGTSLAVLGGCYADAICASGVPFDMLLGPAYKGIPLAAATAIAFHAHHDRTVPFAFNRKEVKHHGEGGTLIGAPLRGRVLIIDDVVSAGTSVRESIALIEAGGTRPAGVAVALDRQERGRGSESATQEITREFGLPCIAIARLDDLITYLHTDAGGKIDTAALRRYRAQYGV